MVTTTDGIVSVGTAKMIGFLLAICGNTLIACSLTLQKSAHNALSDDDHDHDDMLERQHPHQTHSTPFKQHPSEKPIRPKLKLDYPQPAVQHVDLTSIADYVHPPPSAANTTTPFMIEDSDAFDPESQLRLPPSVPHSPPTPPPEMVASYTSPDALAFLRNPTWWIGTFLMAAGEIGNFAAFAFAPASLVAPLGAWSVVLSAILAHVFLREAVSNVNVLGIALCVTGAFLIGTSGPDVSAAEAALDAGAVTTLLLRPPFVLFMLITLTATVALMHVSRTTSLGERCVFVYVGVSSLLGGVTVVCAKALSTFLRLTIEGNSQFGNWLPFALVVILALAILAQLRYLNLAMAKFGNAQVIPVYYVLFTSCAMTSGVIMYREFDALALRNVPFFVGLVATMTGVALVSRSTQAAADLGITSDFDASLRTRKTGGEDGRYDVVLPGSPMSSPRSGSQQAVW